MLTHRTGVQGFFLKAGIRDELFVVEIVLVQVVQVGGGVARDSLTCEIPGQAGDTCPHHRDFQIEGIEVATVPHANEVSRFVAAHLFDQALFFSRRSPAKIAGLPLSSTEAPDYIRYSQS